MVVRRSDARRRRIVVDPNQSSESDGGVTAAPTAKSKKNRKKDVLAYSYGANRRNHHKTTDLIPKRVVAYLLVVLAMVASLALINYGATNAHQWTGHIGAEGVDSLAIRGSGTIANWFSSFLLIMTGLASLQIYALRRHRCDDYRGTYRLWGWMAALFLFASVNCVVNLGSIFSSAFQSLTQVPLSEKPWMLVTFKIAALSILVGRGLYEVRESRGSLAWVVLVWLGYSAATILQLPEANSSLVDLKPDMMVGNCVLVATIGLFMAHLTYARFIFLQAHGLIKLKVKKKKVAKPKSVKTKPVAKKKKATTESEDESESKKKTTKKVAAKKSTKTAKPKTSKTKTAAKTDSKPETKPAKKSAKKVAAAQPAHPIEEPEDTSEKQSPKLSLKEMAAASRAKDKARRDAKMQEEEEEPESIIKLSKAQRRKMRKAKRNNRRAA